MKLTSQMLRRIIKEELQKAVLKEAADPQLLKAVGGLVKQYGLAAVAGAVQLMQSTSAEMDKKSSKNAMMMDPEAAAAWRASMGI